MWIGAPTQVARLYTCDVDVVLREAVYGFNEIAFLLGGERVSQLLDGVVVFLVGVVAAHDDWG